MTILGRIKSGQKINSCCSVLEQQAEKGFTSNLTITFRNFGTGLSKLPYLSNHPDLKNIVKTSLLILITAESACILSAETVDLIFYKQSVLLSSILGLLVGLFTVVGIEAYKKVRPTCTNVKTKC